MPQPPVFSQITLIVQNMDASLGFYRRLGVTVDAAPGAVHAATHLQGGMLIEWDTIEFVAQWDTGWKRATGGSAVLGFSVPTREAVDEVYKDLTGAGHHGHQPPYDAFWGGRYAIVDDPDGHSVGIMSPNDPGREFWPPSQPPRAP